MNVSPLRSKTLLLLALSALGLTVGHAAGQLESLLTNSPFGSVKAGQPVDTGNQPVEFRGVLEENGQQLFSVYDTATKRSRWVGLNDPSGEVVVKSYDADARTISLEQNGRALSLVLKSGPRLMVQNTPPPMPAGTQSGLPGLPGQVLPNGAGKGPEAQRLQQIAEEIRRRRALRQQAPQMPTPAMPGSGGPVPQPGAGTGPIPMPSTAPGSSMGPVPTGAPGSSQGPIPNYPPPKP